MEELVRTTPREGDTVNDIETLARRRLALVEQKESLEASIADIDTQLVNALEVGGTVDLDGAPVFRVAQKRTFSLELAREVLPPEVIKSAETVTVDEKALKAMIPPALLPACQKPGKIFVSKAGK
jgi:hypothetical protein